MTRTFVTRPALNIIPFLFHFWLQKDVQQLRQQHKWHGINMCYRHWLTSCKLHAHVCTVLI